MPSAAEERLPSEQAEVSDLRADLMTAGKVLAGIASLVVGGGVAGYTVRGEDATAGHAPPAYASPAVVAELQREVSGLKVDMATVKSEVAGMAKHQGQLADGLSTNNALLIRTTTALEKTNTSLGTVVERLARIEGAEEVRHRRRTP
jgi:hypothetical protein